MGIDIYAIWKGQTEVEEIAQASAGFSLVLGQAG
jgi:hypothetical protein